MSELTRNAATAIATFWKRGSEDEFGRQAYSLPVLLNVTYDVASKHKYSSNGIEITPSSVIWLEVIDNNPSKGDMIMKGDYSLYTSPVDGAETIKEATISDCSFLGDTDDLMLII